jgi:DUF971 family protein
MSIPQPTEIALHQASQLVEITFSDGVVFRLPCEFLRVYSPSAEVRGHGSGQEVLQTGKRQVQIAAIEPVGSYAVRLAFSDGHDTGLYSWEYLYHLGKNQDRLWREYLDRLADRTVGGSCINHTATGCSLPRQMRADTCNTYYCNSMRGWQALRASGKTPLGAFVIQREQDNWNQDRTDLAHDVVGISVVTESGARSL